MMKDYLGRFSEESLSQFYDSYTRCERPDGSVYGTSGQCRKGKETGAKEEEPKKRGIVGRVKDKVKAAVRKVTGAEAREKAAAEKAKEEADRAQKAEARKKENARKMANTDDMVERLKNDIPKNAKVENDGGTLKISAKTKSGHEIEYSVTRSGNVDFTVNGEWDAGTVKDRREQLEVALTVKRMHEATVKNLREGHTLWTQPWGEDGKGEARAKAYEAMGFSKPQGEEKNMMAVRTSDGKLKPNTSGDANVMADNDFSEEGKKKEIGEIKLWHQAIFGDEWN